jgi:diacylglycerol kinase (ATP)
MTADVIVNRNVRRLTGDTRLRRTLLTAAAAGGARVVETTSLDELDEAARLIEERGTGGVVLAGGDGSHMAGVSALSRAFGGVLPPVALAPCGTVCTVARNFGARGRSREWTRRLVEAVCAGAAPVRLKTTLRVRDDSGMDRVGFIFGAGLVSRFFDVYYGASRQGLTTAASIAARVFIGSFSGSPLAHRVLDPARCTLAVDGAAPHDSHAWGLVLASAVRDVGLHLLATYRAGESTDRFHMVASGLPARALARQMPRVFMGRPLRGAPRIDTLARSMRLCFDVPSGTYVLDGDVFRTREAHVEVGPALPLLVL